MSVSAAALAALSPRSAAAQNWTGATSNDWTVGSNWTGGTAPAGGAVSITTNSNVILGVAAGATGTTGNFKLGGGAPGVTANLTIQNGAVLTTTGASLSMGGTTDTTSTMTVTGAGSRWNINGIFNISAVGTNTLNIENGATVVSTGRMGVTSPSGIGSGTLNIRNGTLETTNITIGNAGGQVNYDNAVVRATADIANFFGGTINQNNIAAGGLTFDTSGHNVAALGLSGVGGLTKTGAGTFSLRTGSTFTGDTVIQQGTLALTGPALTAADALANSNRVVVNATFDISGINPTGARIQSLAGTGIVTLGTKNLIITNAHDTFAGVISGTGGLTINSGMQTLSGVNTYTGATTVSGGTLAVNGSLCGATSVLAGGTLQGTGRVCDMSNAGIVAPGNSIGTLTVAGNYTGNGGTLQIETILGGDGSPTDRLVVTGNTAGSTNVRVINLGGTGAQTAEGIKIVDVTGASNGTFSLLGNYVLQGQQVVVAGAYGYALQKNGVSNPADGDWYLRSSLINPVADPGAPVAPAGPLYQPGVPLYENYAEVLLGMNALPSLQDRVGNRYWGGGPSEAMARMGLTSAAPSQGSQTGSWAQSAFWGRVEGGQSSLQPSNTTGSTYNADQFKAQAGLDGQVLDNAQGRLIVGLTLQYGLTTAYVNSLYGNGRIRAQGSGVGATATWYGDNGFYVDGQAQTMFYRGDLNSDLVGSLIHGNQGLGYAFSVEGGKRIGVGNSLFVTPQAQLAYSKVEFDAFADRFGALASLANSDSLLGRVGLSLNHQKTWNDGAALMRSDVYAIGNLHYEFLDGSRVDVSGTSLASANDRLWGSIGGGGSYAWANGRYSLFGEATYRASLKDASASHGYKGTAGFRVVW
jgi:fibronectin-binding autotransporter adhesin